MTALDWIFWAIAAPLALAGLALLYLGLFHDRARGRRRCPKCWYDMAGIEGLKCPECGGTAKNERRLRRTRRRGLASSAALVLLAASAMTPRFANGLRYGWAAAFPDWALVRLPADLAAWSDTVLSGSPSPQGAITTEIERRRSDRSFGLSSLEALAHEIEKGYRDRGAYGVSPESRRLADQLGRSVRWEPGPHPLHEVLTAVSSALSVPVRFEPPDQEPSKAVVVLSRWPASAESVLEIVTDQVGGQWTISEGAVVLQPGGSVRPNKTIVYPLDGIARVRWRYQHADPQEAFDGNPRPFVGWWLDDREADAVADILTREIEPVEWLDNGGDTAGLFRVGNNLVVRATESAHIQIEELFAALRAAPLHSDEGPGPSRE